MKRFLLDLTEAELPTWWPDTHPRQIAVAPGLHLKQLDVMPSEMAKPWAAEHLEIKRSMGVPFNPEMPIGFDLVEIPKGAKILVQ